MDLSRTRIFDLLAASLDRYARLLRSSELEIFGFNMPRERPDGWSIDPALLETFERPAPAAFESTADALRIAADFIDEEVVRIWKIDEGHVVANDFRVAASRPGQASQIIRELFY